MGVAPFSRSLTVRQLAGAGVAAAGLEALISALAAGDRARPGAAAQAAPAALPSAGQVVLAVVALVMLALVPRLWRGTRTAVWLAIAALATLAVLNIAGGPEYEDATLEVGLALLLVKSRRAFPLGSRNRPRPVLMGAGIGAWLLTYAAVLAGHVGSGHHHVIRRVLRHAIRAVLRASVPHAHVVSAWVGVAEVLIVLAVVISVLAVRSLLRPAGGGKGHSDAEHRAARDIAQRCGLDSLSPFILRPDKALHFAADGVLAYRLIGDTAVVSGDPVAPPGAAPEVLRSFLALARRRGWHVTVWGAGARHLHAYRDLGLRAVCAGEEAFVDPARFTLEGRRVRKLRQSVHRIERRGWDIAVCDGRDMDAALEAEIDALEAAWRAAKPRVLGFAMGMGTFKPEVGPHDLYVLGRSPDGQLGAVMRFFWHCGRLSLDAMRRVGDTPNGLNEALVARALEAARERGAIEVSLNYAGLAHLSRVQRDGRGVARYASRATLALLGRRFQLERLVRFNDKFLPEWRPRFLVCDSPVALPRAVVRVLQAEAYLPQPQPLRLSGRLRHLPRPAARWAHPKPAG